MGFLLRLGSYLFHPLFMPLLGWLCYILVQPNYPNSLLLELSYKKILLFTWILPILFWIYLKSRGKISDWDIEKVQERNFPLLFGAACLLALLFLQRWEVLLPVKAFIYGLLSAIITCWLLAFIGYKISLHQMGISALLVFVISLSVYFHFNLLFFICGLTLANGWVASSRLYLKKHSPEELILGAIIGGLPQLYLVAYWL